jgi:tRNA(fMet)-specific endonuclease VapC
MPLRYLLDTNICIYIARDRPVEVVARFEKLQPGDVAMSIVTYGELCYGARKSRYRSENLNVLNELISIIPVIPLNAGVGDHYGEVRALLERSGRLIGNNDLWIASHALSLRVPLVTNNEKEFHRVPGLIVQNWVNPKDASKIHEKAARYHKK